MNKKTPRNEPERLEALRECQILDTGPEQIFDDITFLAAHLCEAPISMISLVDAHREWFKAKVGLQQSEVSRKIAFCAETILHPSEMTIVRDATKDVRFATNPLVTSEPKIRFYAGAPLVTKDGYALGALCVIDLVPRELSAEQLQALRVFRRQVVTELEFRRNMCRLARTQAELRKSEEQLELRVQQRTRELEQANNQLRREVEERKLAEQSKALLAGIVQFSQDAIMTLDLEGKITTWNAAAESIYGYSQSEAIGSHVEITIPPKDRAAVMQRIDRVRKGQAVKPFEAQRLHKSGATLSLSISISPVKGESGAVVGISKVARDITDAKRLERQLEEALKGETAAHQRAEAAKAHFRALFESAPGLYLVLEPHRFGIVAASEAYLRATLTRREEIIGREMFDVFPDKPDDPEADAVKHLRASLERVREKKIADVMAVQRYPIRRPKEEKRGGWEVRYWSPLNSPVIGPSGELEYIIHRVEDVTEYVREKQSAGAWEEGRRTLEARAEHMEAEIVLRAHELQRLNEELRHSEERFRLIVENVKDFAIFTFDAAGTINNWNPGAERLFGYKQEEIIGKNVEILYTAEDRKAHVPAREREIAFEERCAENVRWHVKKTGEPFFVSGAVRPLLDEVGRIRGFAKVARDITEMKRTEDSLRNLTGHLLQLQDHERRRIGREMHDSTAQSLAALEMNLGRISRAERYDERCRNLLEESRELAAQCANEIRTLSYLLHPPLLDELGLVSALKWYVKGFSERSGFVVDLEVPENLGRLESEVELTVFRIVREGLANVHRHSGSGRAWIRLGRRKGAVVVEVEDEGKGLEKNPLAESPDGPTLGVGLAGMRERVRQLNGTLEITAARKGTIVRAKLPA